MSLYASSAVKYDQLMQVGSSSGEEEDEEDVLYTRRQHPKHVHATQNGWKKSKTNRKRRPLLIRRRQSPSPVGAHLRSRDGGLKSVVCCCCSHCTSSCTHYTSCTCCVVGSSSNICGWAKCVPTAYGVIFFLLFVAFPVHFVDLVITGVSSSSSSSTSSSSVDQCFLIFVCFYSAAILSAILSPISVCLIGFRWTVVCACAGVVIFTLAKCLSVYSDVLVPLSSAINGLTLGAALAAFRSRSTVATETSSKVTTINAETTTAAVSKATTVATETASELSSRCGRILWSCASVYVCLNAASSAASAIFWLALFVPRINRHQVTSSSSSSSSTSSPTAAAMMNLSISRDNVTSPALVWAEVTCGSGFRPSLGSDVRWEAGDGEHSDAEEALVYRRQALIGCFLMCSLGALLLSLAVVDGRRSRPLEAEERSMTFLGRLGRGKAAGRLSEVLGQLVDRNRCFVVVESVFLGSQQLFVYFLYLQAFPGCFLDQINSILVGFTMAFVGLVMSYPVAIVLWKCIGRVKLLLTSFALMTSLILVMLYFGSMSRAWVIYCVACLWSVCDCCLHIGITAFIGVELVDDHRNSPDHSAESFWSVFTTGHLCGQFIIFLIAGQSLTIAAYALLGLTAAAACCHLAMEISTRLAETETRERRGKTITIQMNENPEGTWLPLSNPTQRTLEDDVIFKLDSNSDSMAE